MYNHNKYSSTITIWTNFIKLYVLYSSKWWNYCEDH